MVQLVCLGPVRQVTHSHRLLECSLRQRRLTQWLFGRFDGIFHLGGFILELVWAKLLIVVFGIYSKVGELRWFLLKILLSFIISFNEANLSSLCHQNNISN